MSLPSLLLTLATVAPVSADIRPIECDSCAAWNAPQAPFRLHGDSWYVGTRGLSAVLVATPEGLVLIDGGLPQSAPRIAENVEALGHAMADVRWLLNSHAHYDHAGGLAALQRMSGAPVRATPSAAKALREGASTDDDPQAGYRPGSDFPPVAEVREMQDGESFELGGVRFTLHASPGHTPGGHTWTWRSCEGGDCRQLVYADSVSAVAAPGFRYSDDPARVAAFRQTLAKIAALPCDLLVSAHPNFSGVLGTLASRPAGAEAPPAQAGACKTYAAGGEAWLSRRLAAEAAGEAD